MREERNPYFNRKLERERAISMLFIFLLRLVFAQIKEANSDFLCLLICLVAKKVREKKISVFIFYFILFCLCY